MAMQPKKKKKKIDWQDFRGERALLNPWFCMLFFFFWLLMRTGRTPLSAAGKFAMWMLPKGDFKPVYRHVKTLSSPANFNVKGVLELFRSCPAAREKSEVAPRKSRCRLAHQQDVDLHPRTATIHQRSVAITKRTMQNLHELSCHSKSVLKY